MNKKEYRYEIGDKTYIQRPLVLGQIKQLSNVLDSVSISMLTNEMEMARLLLDNVAPVIAVVITEEGKSPQDKNIDELAEALEFTMDAETMAQVVQDFFACNPVASIYGKVSQMVNLMKKTPQATGSTGSVSSSPEETLQDATGSSGGSPQESASPGPTTGPVT